MRDHESAQDTVPIVRSAKQRRCPCGRWRISSELKGIKYRNIQYRQPFRHPALRRGGVAEKLSAERSNVKNITVTVDDETYRRARIKAAERDTSVSALIRCFLAGRESNAGGAEARGASIAGAHRHLSRCLRCSTPTTSRSQSRSAGILRVSNALPPGRRQKASLRT